MPRPPKRPRDDRAVSPAKRAKDLSFDAFGVAKMGPGREVEKARRKAQKAIRSGQSSKLNTTSKPDGGTLLRKLKKRKGFNLSGRGQKI